MFNVSNIHERQFAANASQIADLMASLASKEDRLWPRQWWPAMRFDRPLAEGAVGGHGPIRYTVARYTPDECIVFRFTAPAGFNGTHALYIDPVNETACRLRHELKMKVSGPALLTWPLLFRPLHDALIEDAFNVAQANLTQTEPQPNAWSWYVRTLRRLLARRRR